SASALLRPGTGSRRVSSVPWPSTVTASRSAKRIRVEQVGKDDQGGSHAGARLEEPSGDDGEAALAHGSQFACLRIPAEITQSRPAVGGGEVDLRVELGELAEVERCSFQYVSGDVTPVRLTQEVAGQRLIGDGREEAGVDEHAHLPDAGEF